MSRRSGGDVMDTRYGSQQGAASAEATQRMRFRRCTEFEAQSEPSLFAGQSLAGYLVVRNTTISGVTTSMMSAASRRTRHAGRLVHAFHRWLDLFLLRDTR